jgi:hypothetical protein
MGSRSWRQHVPLRVLQLHNADLALGLTRARVDLCEATQAGRRAGRASNMSTHQGRQTGSGARGRQAEPAGASIVSNICHACGAKKGVFCTLAHHFFEVHTRHGRAKLVPEMVYFISSFVSGPRDASGRILLAKVKAPTCGSKIKVGNAQK